MSVAPEHPTGAVDLASEPPMRLGELEVVPALRQVRRGGCVSVLEPRVMQVLVVLARAEGRVVSRRSLIDRCWQGRVVVDNAVARAISRLRALADGPGAGQFTIEAIPRVGYRLVLTAADAGDAAPAAASRRRWLGAAGALVLGAAVAAVAVSDRPRAWRRDAEVDDLLVQARMARQQSLLPLTVQAAAFAERATEHAPMRADAWGLLALVSHELAVGHSEPAHRLHWSERSRSAIERALTIDPADRDGRATQVLSPLSMMGWAAGERRLREALQIDPGHRDLSFALGRLLEEFGRWREAAAVHQRLAAAHPLWVAPVCNGTDALWAAGRIAEADAEAQRALRLWPAHGSVWEVAFRLQALTGRADAALDFALRHPPPPAPVLPQAVAIGVARALASGAESEVEVAAGSILQAHRERHIGSATAVQLLAALGCKDEALNLLEGFLQGDGAAGAARPIRRSFVLFRPSLRHLRDEERYLALLEHTGLAEHWRRGGPLPDGWRRPS